MAVVPARIGTCHLVTARRGVVGVRGLDAEASMQMSLSLKIGVVYDDCVLLSISLNSFGQA